MNATLELSGFSQFGSMSTEQKTHKRRRGNSISSYGTQETTATTLSIRSAEDPMRFHFYVYERASEHREVRDRNLTCHICGSHSHNRKTATFYVCKNGHCVHDRRRATGASKAGLSICDGNPCLAVMRKYFDFMCPKCSDKCCCVKAGDVKTWCHRHTTEELCPCKNKRGTQDSNGILALRLTPNDWYTRNRATENASISVRAYNSSFPDNASSQEGLSSSVSVTEEGVHGVDSDSETANRRNTTRHSPSRNEVTCNTNRIGKLGQAVQELQRRVEHLEVSQSEHKEFSSNVPLEMRKTQFRFGLQKYRDAVSSSDRNRFHEAIGALVMIESALHSYIEEYAAMIVRKNPTISLLEAKARAQDRNIDSHKISNLLDWHRSERQVIHAQLESSQQENLRAAQASLLSMQSSSNPALMQSYRYSYGEDSTTPVALLADDRFSNRACSDEFLRSGSARRHASGASELMDAGASHPELISQMSSDSERMRSGSGSHLPDAWNASQS